MNSLHRGAPSSAQRSGAAARQAAIVSYVNMPLLQVLFRYLWPFWMFKDASRGDRMTRAAAYRHNRGMRIYLPGYLAKWVVSCGVILAMTELFYHLASSVQGTIDVFVLMAAALGMALACGICVLLITAYLYVYLSHHDYEH